jgi:hypothetical protein
MNSSSPPSGAAPQFTNRLIHESSPYLVQHAHNPVDWYPWGPEAHQRARAEDKPILLSIGYSACHWCHVMAHESFEDEATARVMNELFVNIKVDREERPDLDEVYMNAVQLVTHHGGWPMTVFLTPDLEPFFGGTYYPPEERHGMPSFRAVLAGMSEAYQTQRTEVGHNAKLLVEELRRMGEARASAKGELEPGLLRRAYGAIASGFEPRFGGFGHAPKFPSTMSLSLCLRHWRRTGEREALRIVTHSLERMAAGGIHDQIGGGFHRYSVDQRWLVPHFEKMLYDNALLARLYVEAWQATGDEAWRRVAAGVLGYVRRDLSRPGGGFHSTEDADSEGEEGKFYVWTPAEVKAVLGDGEGELFCRVYDVSAGGNFEHGWSILNLPRSIGEQARDLGLDPGELESRLARGRLALFAVREKRVRPFRDEKVLVAWNGLMLAAMSFAARALDSEADRRAAIETGEFLWRELRRDRRLLHTWKDGVAKLDAYLDDVAALGTGFVELYQTTFDPLWLERARELADTLLAEFEDPACGGFWYTAAGSEKLIARSKNPYDNAVPGGNSLAVHLLLQLAALGGDPRFAEAADRALEAFAPHAARAPMGFAHLLEALDARLGGFTQIVIAGEHSDPATRALAAAATAGYHPNRVVALAEPGRDAPPELRALLAGKTPVAGRPAAYLCRDFTCQRPATAPAELTAALGPASGTL